MSDADHDQLAPASEHLAAHDSLRPRLLLSVGGRRAGSLLVRLERERIAAKTRATLDTSRLVLAVTRSSLRVDRRHAREVERQVAESLRVLRGLA